MTDTQPSVHMYRSDTASQTALQLPTENGRTSGLLHIITDGTQYTEHTVDVHSNRTCNITEEGLWCFRVTILPWKRNKYFILPVRESPQLFSTQSALRPVWIYIFSTLSLKTHDILKYLLSVKSVSNDLIYCRLKNFSF